MYYYKMTDLIRH